MPPALPATLAAAAVIVLCSPAASARADCLGVSDALHRVEATVQSLIAGQPKADHDVIAPPGDVDPKMALAPPQAGIMRIIPPPSAAGR